MPFTLDSALAMVTALAISSIILGVIRAAREIRQLRHNDAYEFEVLIIREGKDQRQWIVSTRDEEAISEFADQVEPLGKFDEVQIRSIEPPPVKRGRRNEVAGVA